MPPLRVVIDARRLPEGVAGGVEQVMIGLAHGLSSLEDGDEEYFFLTSPSDPEWIVPYLSGRCRVLPSPGAHDPPRWRARLANVAPLRAAWEVVSPVIGPRTIPVARSDGTIERAGADVIHFPQQSAFLTDVASVYQPHDLQHRHLPRYFSPRTRLARDVTYRAFCAQASAVVMMTEWGRRDIIDAFGLAPDKVCVVPGASVLGAYPAPSAAQIRDTRAKFALPDEFAFFPAQTFPHKNHLTLLDALAVARDRHGVTIPLVASGFQNAFFEKISRRADALGLRDQVRFVGFVSPVELRALYRLARCLVFPSTFEGWGLPIVEAMHEGLPVVCSDATSLPEVASGAAALFPAHDAEAMAGALIKVWADDALRAELIVRGRARATELSWGRTAVMFREIYRRVAGRSVAADALPSRGGVPVL